jgi:hypothetical protein
VPIRVERGGESIDAALALEDRAGYFCADTFTPLTQNVFAAARDAANVALTAATVIANGELFAYALKVSYDVIHGYHFDNFDYVEIKSLTDGRSSKVLKEDLNNYKPRKTKIEDVMVFDAF